jgi:hypothetical protein
MEDPVSELRDVVATLDYWWPRPISPLRDMKLAAIDAKLKQVRQMIKEQIQICRTN